MADGPPEATITARIHVGPAETAQLTGIGGGVVQVGLLTVLRRPGSAASGGLGRTSAPL
ncbi:hypothetical protein ACIRBZ_01000 [Streptomyces sp. NPDC094038]|uniref:hypothetical protein n=1 Tax=Streptomyces sp. NPDC094038 TaxID=3366055 RepID=UPI00380D87B3